MKEGANGERMIVFVNQVAGYLTIDIVNRFAGEFEKTALITGHIREQSVVLDNRVSVSLISRYNRGNVIKKGISWILGTVQIFFLLRFKYSSYEKVYFTIPPLAYLLAPLFRSHYSIIVFNLYPDTFLALGLGTRNILYRMWGGLNRKIFSSAYRVFTLSEQMKTAIKNYSPASDVHVVSAWSEFSGVAPVEKGENRFISETGLKERFIVQYSGTIGLTDKVEALIELADLLKSEDDIVFVIIGRGGRLNRVISLIESRGLSNCLIFPFRRDDELFDSLCAADIAVITMDEKYNYLGVPSKIYNILPAGVPLLAIASEDSVIADLVRMHGNGEVFRQNDLHGMCRYILSLKNSRLMHSKYSARSVIAAGSYTPGNAGRYLECYQTGRNAV